MAFDEKDAPPGFRAVPSDGYCRCAATRAPCAFRNPVTGCSMPSELLRGHSQPCMDSVRPDGVLTVFLKIETFGNEED